MQGALRVLFLLLADGGGRGGVWTWLLQSLPSLHTGGSAAAIDLLPQRQSLLHAVRAGPALLAGWADCTEKCHALQPAGGSPA